MSVLQLVIDVLEEFTAFIFKVVRSKLHGKSVHVV